MTQLTDVRVAPAPRPLLTGGARWLILRLSTDNPFYVLSALLVLLGLWTSFGAQASGGQAWALMGGLAVYTLLLAVPACLLVRFGGVWEDVRTVLLVVVLMFLATSVTFDETIARDPALGARCSLAGLTFAALLSEVLLRVMRLRLPAGFRVPYHLALALFFLFPVALLPVLDRPRSAELEWSLYGFGPLAGLVALTLLPAARRGAAYARDNGSPWAWPYYPWALFAFLAFGVLGRSFLLCWSMEHVERSDPERLIFGPYFLAPFVLTAGLVVLEAGRAAGHRGVTRAGMLLPALGAVLSGVGHRPDDLYRGFFLQFVGTLGATPLYLALLAATLFYALAAVRKVPHAGRWLTAALLALAVVGPHTGDFQNLSSPRPEPLALAAVLVLVSGLARRSEGRCVLGIGLLATAALAGPWSPPVAEAIAFHVVVAGFMAVGTFHGDLARALRTLGPWLAAGAGLLAATGRVTAPDVPSGLLSAYPPVLAAALAAYGLALRHRPSVAAALAVLAGWLAANGWRTYADLRQTVVGLDAIVMGLVLLALAECISLAKAGLLPRRLGKAPSEPSLVD